MITESDTVKNISAIANTVLQWLLWQYKQCGIMFTEVQPWVFNVYYFINFVSSA